MGIEPFDYSVTQTLNVSCIFCVVVEDSLRVGCLRPVKFIIRTARGECYINNLTSTMLF